MRHGITIVPLGPGDPGLMTLQTAEALKKASCLLLRTARHGAAAWLEEQGIAYQSLDALYDQAEVFDELNRAAAEEVLAATEHHPVTYAVPDPTTDRTVAALRAIAPEGTKITALAGVSRADQVLSALPETPESGLRILSATDVADAAPDPKETLLITELNDPILAGEVKLRLGQIYNDDMPVWFFPPDGDKAQRKAKRVLLSEIDRQKHYDHTCALAVPPAAVADRDRACFADLVEIMRRLRGENGCPWDREQTHQSLRKYMIEEAYEAAGAIDDDDMDHLADELGDVLLQVVFHAQVGAEHGEFDIGDVTTAICRKMIHRHPWVFHPESGVKPVDGTWEKLKKEEKKLGTQAEVLRDVTRALPALTRAQKVQAKAAQVGFDWDSALDALPKVTEEAGETAAELTAGRDPTEELGDLLFSCVNVARLAGKDPEQALNAATEKFIRRFSAMESLILADGLTLEGLTLAEMDVYWVKVKTASEG